MFHVKHPWEEWAAEIGLTLPAGAPDRLERYRELLRERAVPIGMVAPGDADRLADRHIWDSARAAGAIAPGQAVVDLGSGAGLPGIPLAIVCDGARFVLAELRRNRAAFLELAADVLPLPNVEVILGGVEALPPAEADVVVARAFADPRKCWAAASRLLRPRGRLLYWAGQGFSSAGLPEEVTVVMLPPPSQLAEAGPVVIMSAQ